MSLKAAGCSRLAAAPLARRVAGARAASTTRTAAAVPPSAKSPFFAPTTPTAARLSWSSRRSPLLLLAARGNAPPAAAAAARWSSSSSSAPSESRIWTFEEIQDLLKTKTENPTATTAAGGGGGPPSYTLIDVREPGELASTGRIPGAVNVPVASSPDAFHLGEEDFEDRFGFDKPGSPFPTHPTTNDGENNNNQHHQLIFYCKAGVRSRAAAALARDAGWRGAVGEFPGSWVEWVGRGGKVER